MGERPGEEAKNLTAFAPAPCSSAAVGASHASSVLFGGADVISFSAASLSGCGSQPGAAILPGTGHEVGVE
eukprot:1220650-Karenia_brevis.AAC.1